MDEVSFGPRREIRRPARRRRAFTAAVAVAGAAAAGVALAVTVTSAHQPASPHPATQPSALAVPLSRLPPAGCPPVQAAWPDLAGLPAGMRPGVLPIIAEAQFSGQCTVP
jgi:hypothetical protein